MLEAIRRIGRRVLGANRRYPLRNHDIDPDQPTRSAITVAGICGYTDNNARILGSAALIADSTGARSYRGGPSLASAAATVLRATPSCLAIARCDNFSL